MSETGGIHRLPSELLSPIFENLDPASLFCTILTCKSFAETGLELLYSNVDINLRLALIQDWFSEVLEQTTSVGKTPTPTEHLKATEDGLYAFKQLRLFATLAKSEAMASLVKRLSLHIVHHSEDEKTLAPDIYNLNVPLKLFLGMLSENKLTGLSAPYQLIEEVGRFQKLTRLHLHMVWRDSFANIRIPDTKLPNLRRLSIHWSLSTANLSASSKDSVLGRTCELICYSKTVAELSVKMFSKDTGISEPGQVINWENSILGVLNDLKLPNLRALAIEYPTSLACHLTFLNNPSNQSESDEIFDNGLTGPRHVWFHDVFATLANRHKDQLLEVEWFANFAIMKGPGLGLPHRTLQPFIKTRKLKLGIGCEYIDQRQVDYGWLSRLATTDLPELEVLYISKRQKHDDGFYRWIAHNARSFKHVTRLMIDNVRFVNGPPSLDKDPLLDLFGASNTRDLCTKLPPKLQYFLVEFVANPSLAFPPLGIIGKFIPAYPSLFESLPTLSFVDVVHATTTFHTKGPYHALIMSRCLYDAASEYANSGKFMKKLCVWHIEPAHRCFDGTTNNWHSGLAAYHEYNLRQQEYQGPDGKRFTMGSQGKNRAMRCTGGESGATGGCAEYAMRKAYWVSLPPFELQKAQIENLGHECATREREYSDCGVDPEWQLPDLDDDIWGVD